MAGSWLGPGDCFSGGGGWPRYRVSFWTAPRRIKTVLLLSSPRQNRGRWKTIEKGFKAGVSAAGRRGKKPLHLEVAVLTQAYEQQGKKGLVVTSSKRGGRHRHPFQGKAAEEDRRLGQS